MLKSPKARLRLPASPSQEHLRKLAKRLAKSEKLKLAAVQRRLANDYGFATWAALMRGVVGLLIDGGATATPQSVLVALAHRQVAPIRTLLDRGVALTVPMAAALGRGQELMSMLANAPSSARQEALALAVVNGQADAARLCLDAGADINAFMPVHSHSTPLHQASVNGDVEMLRLLVARGASLDTRDKLWDGTPLGRAIHTKKRDAEAFLRAAAKPPS